MSKFSKTVEEMLGFYVYRLIDPRNGETFYVGKGKGSRVFSHARGEENSEGDDLTDKLARIREIRVSGFEVAHVIHRHGLTDDQAFEVEAALIDAYPEVANQVSGKASGERGLMHANQIVEKYQAPVVEFRHRVILITINRTVAERESVYAAVRYAWKLGSVLT
ncbi:MAG: LEM-3-like GIY-YIG domain-containing protein [Aestuariivirga sp.]